MRPTTGKGRTAFVATAVAGVGLMGAFFLVFLWTAWLVGMVLSHLGLHDPSGPAHAFQAAAILTLGFLLKPLLRASFGGTRRSSR